MILRKYLLAFAIVGLSLATRGEDWPQFRGPGGRGISETATPPISFGPSSNLVWSVPVPEGFSSPIVAGDRIFLTAMKAEKFETLALDRKDGRIVWRQHALENKDNEASNAPIPTPVSDGKSVFVLFGKIGLIACDVNGNEQWREPLNPSDQGASASPILIDDKLIVVSDQKSGSFVEARDKKSGRVLWRTERPLFKLARATPFHWVHGKESQLIVSGSPWLTSYDPKTGREKWRYGGVARWAMSSPTATDALLFSVTSKIGVGEEQDPASDSSDPASVTSLTDFGQLTKVAPSKSESSLMAIRSGGIGNVSETHLAWKSLRGLPYGSSPLVYKGRMFTVKEGGFVSAYDAKTGRIIYQDERLNSAGSYYASAVAAEGRIYFASEPGVVTVLDASADTPTILAQNKIGGQILATPALVDQMILFRTTSNLFAFGSRARLN